MELVNPKVLVMTHRGISRPGRLATCRLKGVRKLLVAVAVAVGVPVAWLLLSCPPAKADVGGQVPGPGLCEYPGIGGSGMVMSSYYYYCDFPTELNGSHWHCQYGGFAIQAIGGVSILMFSGGITGNVGGLNGTCSWRCPDMTMAEAPNPPGGWKEGIRPTNCNSIGPNPEAPPAEVPAPASAPEPLVGPTVTDPVFPNPDATTNSGNR
jgi:hypothetical protein